MIEAILGWYIGCGIAYVVVLAFTAFVFSMESVTEREKLVLLRATIAIPIYPIVVPTMLFKWHKSLSESASREARIEAAEQTAQKELDMKLEKHRSGCGTREFSYKCRCAREIAKELYA